MYIRHPIIESEETDRFHRRMNLFLPPSTAAPATVTTSSSSSTITTTAAETTSSGAKEKEAMPTTADLRQRMRDYGFLPSKEVYSFTKRQKKRVQQATQRLNRLMDSGDIYSIYSRLQGLQQVENMFEREGKPAGWGNVGLRLSMVRGILRDARDVVKRAESLASDLERREKIQQTQKNRKPHTDAVPQNPPIFWLPDELLVLILARLKRPNDVKAVGCTCRRFSGVAADSMVWKQMFMRFTQTENCEKAILKMTRRVPLVQIFGLSDPTIWRELYLRIYYHFKTPFCGICRVRDGEAVFSDRNVGHWSYRMENGNPTDSLSPEREQPSLTQKFDWLAALRPPIDEPSSHSSIPSTSCFNEYWHHLVVEGACIHCKTVLFAKETEVKRAGLAVGPSLPYLYLRWQERLLHRVFIEDTIAYSYFTRSHRDSRRTPLDFLPQVTIKDEKYILGYSSKNTQRTQSIRAWSQQPSFLDRSRIPSQRRTRWFPTHPLPPPDTEHSPTKGTKRKRKENIPPSNISNTTTSPVTICDSAPPSPTKRARLG